MSDDKISLDFLGEQMLRMQADLRGVRAEQVKLESEQASMQAEIAGVRGDVRRVDVKLDSFAASVDARFEQVNQAAATNLSLTLAAIGALERKIAGRD